MNVILQIPPAFKPDVIVTWPRNCDYPTWRYFIRENRDRFNEIIIVFMQPNKGEDYSEFVRNAMFKDYVHFIDSRKLLPGEDWRNVAINEALMHSYNAQWIWFTEQDFIITDDKFWTEVYNRYAQGFDLIGIAQEARLHPASIFVKRDTLNKTSKDFSANPPEYDHFGKFQKEIESMDTNRVYFTNEELNGYLHYNGLSHNWSLINDGQRAVYHEDEFINWLKICLKLDGLVDLDPRFIAVANKAISAYEREL